MKEIKFCVRMNDYFIEYCKMLSECNETPEYKLKHIRHMHEHKFTSGVFNPDLEMILINLSFHGYAQKVLKWTEDKMIYYVCGTIIHESLHNVIYDTGEIDGYSNDYQEELIHELQDIR